MKPLSPPLERRPRSPRCPALNAGCSIFGVILLGFAIGSTIVFALCGAPLFGRFVGAMFDQLISG